MNSHATIFSKKDNKLKTSELTEDQKRSISKEIEKITRNFLNDISYETEVGIRADVEGYVMGGDGKIMFTSYAPFKQYIKEAFTGIQKFTEMNIVALHVYVLSKEAASCTFEMKGRYLTTGGETVTHNACWTLVFKKFDNGWKVVQENGTHTKE